MKKGNKVRYEGVKCKILGVYGNILELKVDSTRRCFANRENCIKLVKHNTKVIPKYKRTLYVEIRENGGGVGHITYSKQLMKEIVDNNNKVYEFKEIREIKL